MSCENKMSLQNRMKKNYLPWHINIVFLKFSSVAFYMCVGKATTVFVMCNFLYGNDCTFTVELF